MQEVKMRDEFSKLGQALTLYGCTESGGDAKSGMGGGKVKVNGERETRRGRRLRGGDTVSFDGREFVVKSPENMAEV